MAPVIPFKAADDGMIHRLSADTNPEWIAQFHAAELLHCIMQCGAFVDGALVARGTLVTCIACIVRHVEENPKWESTDS